jgi:putative ABC transport system ATP-binding protein
LLLLADEPTGALDSATSHQVMAMLSELHEQGMTVIPPADLHRATAPEQP